MGGEPARPRQLPDRAPRLRRRALRAPANLATVALDTGAVFRAAPFPGRACRGLPRVVVVPGRLMVRTHQLWCAVCFTFLVRQIAPELFGRNLHGTRTSESGQSQPRPLGKRDASAAGIAGKTGRASGSRRSQATSVPT